MHVVTVVTVVTLRQNEAERQKTSRLGYIL